MSAEGGTNTTFKRKLAERKAAAQAELARILKERGADPAVVLEKHDDDLVPDEPFSLTDTDREMDRIVGGIDILDAYSRWCGKMTPKVKNGQRESIMISCPKPSHPDKKPSAWINLDDQVWFCGGCQEGGDAHDIAAYHFGFSAPEYKSGAKFHELRREMAKDFGFTFTTLPGGVIVVEPPSTESEEEGEEDAEASTGVSTAGSTVPAGTVSTPEPGTDADVIKMFESDMDSNILIPTLDWQSIVPKDTFLDTYMRVTSLDDVAEEYHFFNGLLALGFALGRDVRLDDTLPVYANLFVCTLGHSGSGKSKARYHLDSLLTDALPHVWSDENSKGVRKISSPGSAEVLIHNFQKPVTDPANPKVVLYNAPVRGIVDFSELSALTGRSGRIGNVIVPTLMQFYDMENLISTSSMSTGIKEAALPFASALTTTQPRALKDLLSKSDVANGFLNRWIFVSGNDKRKVAVGAARIDITPAIAPLQKVFAWAGAFGPDEFMTWSQEAVMRFTEFFHSTIWPAQREDTSTDLLTRTDLLMKKLILLFTANLKLKEVPIECVEQAIACWDYIIGSYAIPADEIGNTLGSEISEAVMNVARKQYKLNKKGVTLNQVARSLAKRKYPHEMLLKTCESLVKLDYLVVVKSPAGMRGRPTVRYKIVGA